MTDEELRALLGTIIDRLARIESKVNAIPDFQKRLERIDAHVIQPEEYEDAPELTDAQLAQADLYEGGKLVRRGRPPK